MRKNEPQTPLLALLRALTPEQRTTFAKMAGTSVSYLYSLGTCQRGKRGGCNTTLAMAIEKASEKMCEITDGKSPIVTARELASMCSLST